MDDGEFIKTMEAILEAVRRQCVLLAKSADQLGRENAFIKARMAAPGFTIKLLDRMVEIGRRPDTATKQELADILSQIVLQLTQPRH